MKYIKYFIALMLLTSAGAEIGWTQVCGQRNPTAEQLEYWERTRINRLEVGRAVQSVSGQAKTSSGPASFRIPLKFWFVLDGSGNQAATKAAVHQAIEDLNASYSGMNIKFFQYGDFEQINNSNWFTLNKDNEFIPMYDNNHKEKVINVYIVGTITDNAGIPGTDGFTKRPPTSRHYFVTTGAAVSDQFTFTHELGHYFSLYHTHGKFNMADPFNQMTPNNATDFFTDELVDGSNCSTAGDGICDTPADPGLWFIRLVSGTGNLQVIQTELAVNPSCVYLSRVTNNLNEEVTLRDGNGAVFSPLTNNYMAYTFTGCGQSFTPTQEAIILGSLLTDRDQLIDFANIIQTHAGTETGERKKISRMQVLSDAVLEPSAEVLYESADEVILQEGFWAKAGSDLNALIGCPVPNSSKQNGGNTNVEMEHFVRAFPNPFSSNVMLEFEPGDFEGTAYLSILDSKGRTIMREAITVKDGEKKLQHTWNASGLPAGIYLYRLDIGTNVHQGKLMHLD